MLQPVAPDTLIVADVQGYEAAPDTSSPTRPDEANRVPAPWAHRVYRVGGPPLGAPHSDLPSVHSCVRGGEPERRTAAVLTEHLRDTTEFGEGWRRALGRAPSLPPADTATFEYDDDVCQQAATVINRDLLRWKVDPPVLLLRAGGHLFAFPSDASIGEFGIVVHLDRSSRILGALTW